MLSIQTLRPSATLQTRIYLIPHIVRGSIPNPRTLMPPKRKQVEKGEAEDVKKAKTMDETSTNEAVQKSKEEGNLNVISWNVDGLRAWVKKGGLDILKNEEPDMLCLQETKCSEGKLPPEVKEIKNYKKYFLSGAQEGYSGVALLSKKEPLSIKYGFDDEVHDKEGRVITAEYDGFYLVTSYVPNAGKKLITLDKRMDWDPKFRSYLKDLDAKKPVILCGDLNVAHKEIDLKNPKTNKKNAGFTQEERDGFTDLLAEGFSDSYRHLYPDKTDQYTFWTYMMNARGKNVGWRLDYFVLSERLLPKMADNIILSKVMGSDHCPIKLLIDI